MLAIYFLVCVSRIALYIYCSHLQWIQNICQHIKLNAIAFCNNNRKNICKCRTNLCFFGYGRFKRIFKPLARYFLTLLEPILTVCFIFIFFFFLFCLVFFSIHFYCWKEEKKTFVWIFKLNAGRNCAREILFNGRLIFYISLSWSRERMRMRERKNNENSNGK